MVAHDNSYSLHLAPWHTVAETSHKKDWCTHCLLAFAYCYHLVFACIPHCKYKWVHYHAFPWCQWATHGEAALKSGLVSTLSEMGSHSAWGTGDGVGNEGALPSESNSDSIGFVCEPQHVGDRGWGDNSEVMCFNSFVNDGEVTTERVAEVKENEVERWLALNHDHLWVTERKQSSYDHTMV